MTAVRAATSRDVPAVVALVEAAALPADGVAELAVEPNTLLVAEDAAGIVGCVGLEAHGDQRLLRSLAVTSRHRGRGVGRRLVDAALAASPDHEVVLLTETAADFFGHLGFEVADRRTVVGPVTTSTEWTALCPDTAIVMVAPQRRSPVHRDLPRSSG